MYKALKEINYFDKYKIIKEPQNDDERDSFFLLLFLIENFNKHYFKLFDQSNIKDYLNLKYEPMVKTAFNSMYLVESFFTLNDKKFYPIKYLKMINFK